MIESLIIFKRRIMALPRLLKDKKIVWWKKLLVVFGIIYLVLPVDLIPPIIPVFGMFDDLILWVFIIQILKDDLDAYLMPQEGGKSEDKYSGRKIVDVEYKVHSDGKQNDEA